MYLDLDTSEKENSLQLTWFGRAGEWVKKNQGDIALVAGFVLVALISFGVGYLSAPRSQKNPIVIEEPSGSISGTLMGGNQPKEAGESINLSPAALEQESEKGIIVASKNGTKYYWPWSSWAKRIKPENLIWFKSEAEAQAAGYSKSSDFDKIAPAGYKR